MLLYLLCDCPPYKKLLKCNLRCPGASQWSIYYHRMWVQLSTICSNVLKQPDGELLVAVNHNQLRTMAIEMVDYLTGRNPHLRRQYPMSATCIV